MNVGWVLGFALGLIGIISHFTWIPGASPYNYWLLVFGFLIVSVSGTRH